MRTIYQNLINLPRLDGVIRTFQVGVFAFQREIIGDGARNCPRYLFFL